MNDLSAIGTFLLCVLSTFGLIRACDWLRPAPARTLKRDEPDVSDPAKGARQ